MVSIKHTPQELIEAHSLLAYRRKRRQQIARIRWEAHKLNPRIARLVARDAAAGTRIPPRPTVGRLVVEALEYSRFARSPIPFTMDDGRAEGFCLRREEARRDARIMMAAARLVRAEGRY